MKQQKQKAVCNASMQEQAEAPPPPLPPIIFGTRNKPDRSPCVVPPFRRSVGDDELRARATDEHG